MDPGGLMATALTDAGIMDADGAAAFGALFSRFSRQHKAPLEWGHLASAPATPYEALEPVPADARLQAELLKKTAILKLNGGLGTSMGCRGPKAAIPIRNGMTFLDLTVRQVEYLNALHGVDVPLVLMNSFRTHDVTVRLLSRYAHHHVTIHCFSQSCFPRLDRDTFLPVPVEPFSAATEASWHPPGHGDVFRSLERSGVLDKLLSSGKEYIFISNVDNLNAALDLRILYHIVTNRINFAMEVTTRTRQDVQGGALVGYEGKPRLLEASQVPSEHLEDFRNLKRFPSWCTNNLWVSLKEIKAALAAGALCPPVIVNERMIPGSGSGGGGSGSGRGGGAAEGSGEAAAAAAAAGFAAPPPSASSGAATPVLELETAAGAAIEFFTNSVGIHVPRTRFLPVKNTADLFAVQSNLYEIRHGLLHLSPQRSIPTPPIIRLGPEFASLEAFIERVHAGGTLPDLLEADHVSVTGNVHFGKGVVLRGSVVIVAAEGSRIDIPPKAELENVVCTGSLRMLGT